MGLSLFSGRSNIAVPWGFTGGEWLYLQHEFEGWLLILIFNTRGLCPHKVAAL